MTITQLFIGIISCIIGGFFFGMGFALANNMFRQRYIKWTDIDWGFLEDLYGEDEKKK